MATKTELEQKVATLEQQLAASQALLASALAAPAAREVSEDELLAGMDEALVGVLSGVERPADEIAATAPIESGPKEALFRKLDEVSARGPKTLARALLKVGVELGVEYLKGR